MRLFKTALLKTYLTLAPAMAIANDAELYDPIPDPNASFVRVIAPADTVAAIDRNVLATNDGASAYVAVDPGTYSVSLGGQDISLTVGAQERYTVAMTTDGTAMALQDLPRATPSQAGVAAYNLAETSGPVSLYVPAAQTNALSDLASGTGQSIALRAPLSVAFEFRVGAEVLVASEEVVLRRNEGVSLVLVGTEGAYEFKVLEHLFGTAP